MSISSTLPTSINNGINNQMEPELLMYNLSSLVRMFSVFSPLILISSIASLTFVFGNFKGLIYLGFVIAAALIRLFVYTIFATNKSTTQTVSKGDMCSIIQYSKYGNATFSAFVFAFTIIYMCVPMFINNSINNWLFYGLIMYGLVDGIYKYWKCKIKLDDLLLNILGGGLLSLSIVFAMYSGGSSKHMFFNEVSSNKEICSMPKKQTFKCQVYKDGTIVGNI